MITPKTFGLSALTLTLALVSTHSAHSASVVTVSGPDDAWVVLFSGQAYGVSWSQLESSSLTSISARLTAFGQTGETGKAYLSTALGTGTTPDSLIAFTSFTFPSQASDLVLFSDLTLAPGTYYLSLIGDSPSWGSGWFGAQDEVIETAPGVELGSNYGFQTRNAFLPSSQVYAEPPEAMVPSFSVTSPVPEPSAAILLAGMAPLALATRHRPKRNK